MIFHIYAHCGGDCSKDYSLLAIVIAVALPTLMGMNGSGEGDISHGCAKKRHVMI